MTSLASLFRYCNVTFMSVGVINFNDPWSKIVLKQLFPKNLFQNHIFKTLEKIIMEAR